MLGPLNAGDLHNHYDPGKNLYLKISKYKTDKFLISFESCRPSVILCYFCRDGDYNGFLGYRQRAVGLLRRFSRFGRFACAQV